MKITLTAETGKRFSDFLRKNGRNVVEVSFKSEAGEFKSDMSLVRHSANFSWTDGIHITNMCFDLTMDEVIRPEKPKVNMHKRHRLELPSDLKDMLNDRINYLNNKIVCSPYGHMFEDCKEDAVICEDTEYDSENPRTNARVMKSWLIPVEDKVQTSDEWVKEDKSRGEFPMQAGHFLDIRHRVKEAFEAGENNQWINHARLKGVIENLISQPDIANSIIIPLKEALKNIKPLT